MRMEPPTSMHEEDGPLDPAAERVRRKLVRFMVVNLGILFAALMAVVVALVYKSGVFSEAPPEPVAVVAPPTPAEIPYVEASIALPAGAVVLSQALSDDRLSLHTRLEDGAEVLFVYDLRDRRMLGRYMLVAQ